MINLALLSAAHIHTKSFLKTIAERPDCRLAAIWDDVHDRGQRYAAESGAAFVGDLHAVIARQDVDGFIICAENTRHLRLLKAAIPAGKPIFCEKPFTTSTAEAAEAMALIRRHGTIVHMGYFNPFSPAMQGVAAMLAENKLGKLTHARFRNAHHAAYGRWFDSPDLAWFTDPALAGGGAFMDMGTHAVHLLRTLLGPAERVFARITNTAGIYPAVDDYGVALVQFASGVTATVEAGWVQNAGPGGLEISGSSATLYNDAKLGYVTVRPKEEPVAVPQGAGKPTCVERLIAAIGGQVSRAELDADLACSIDAVAIVQAAYESSAAGRWVDVPRI